ncbi:uncharacterized protein LOC110730713 [Chenopodium quinoa]|uniref:uncharacterized protein LOC110730713 n=1 Tax=Chenopodium quinoa TaxID=63459 RepID=UPI000B785317|nr:uncharacterized protein LOC110730713 [Chenopodium quinoa]
MAKKKKQNNSTPQLAQHRNSNDPVFDTILQNLRNSGSTFVPSPIQEADELVTPVPALVNPSCGSIPRSDAETIALFAEAISTPASLISNRTGPETLSRIGSLLGIPICSDECTTRQLRVSFAKVLIEIDVTKPFPKSVFVESPSKEILELKVVYEWTPPFCSKCNKVGHDCSAKAPTVSKQLVTAAPKQSVTTAPKQEVWVAKTNHVVPATAATADFTIHGQSVINPNVSTAQNDSDAGWRIVGRKTKSQHTRVNQPAVTSNAFVALIEDETEGDGGFTINPIRGETKVKAKNSIGVQKKFGPSWTWVCNYCCSPKGRIWVGWNADRVTVNIVEIHEQFIHFIVCNKDLSSKIQHTFVYGMHSIHDRLPLWEGIKNISLQQIPWLCVGDFNYVLNSQDRLNGNSVTEYETRDFQNFVDELDLTEIKIKGAFYSWSNKAHSGPRTLTWINRAFGNQSWLDAYGHVETTLSPILRILKFDQAHNDLLDIQNLIIQNTEDSELHVKEADAIAVLLKDPAAVTTEILDFYKSLLGTKAPCLPAVDLVTMRRGKKLSSYAQQFFIQPVSHSEIDSALKSIDNSKAPGIDGFNSFFFKKVWHVSKDDIYASVLDFFENGVLQRQWNCTSITLVPKVPNASHVKDFRPIACCTVVYKLISKIITARLASVIRNFIDDAQAGFILGKHIGDNNLLATELIKGIITAKKGLRQGDPMSLFLFAIAMEYLSRCLYELSLNPDFNFHPRSSSLSTNLDKSEVYFGGVPVDIQTKLSDLLEVSQGSIPFKYLGVPFSSKKLTISQCKPLVEKVTARIQGWMAKHLSYSGRLQLIKSVLFGIQTYWAQIFILPKKILKEIEARFRCFLWTGSSAPPRKSLVSWNSVCLPKVCGGWNLLSLPECNKAAITKLLWDIAHKADDLWVKWVHIYYFKYKDSWTAPIPAKCSWFLKKILSCRDVVNDLGGWDDFIQENENVQHLFFDCEFSRQIWSRVLSTFHVPKPAQRFDKEVAWIKSIAESLTLRVNCCMLLSLRLFIAYGLKGILCFLQGAVKPLAVLSEI